MANNLTKTLTSVFGNTVYHSNTPKPPYESKNAYGETEGYRWYYGDAITLNFHLTGEFTVDSNSIIYTAHNDAPTESTVGTIDQKAYNITDLISWTCVAIVGTTYTWEQDREFIYDPSANQMVYISAKELVKSKYAVVKIYDRMHAVVLEKQFNEGLTDIRLDISTEESETLFPRGIYNCELCLFDTATSSKMTIIDASDCILMVE